MPAVDLVEKVEQSLQVAKPFKAHPQKLPRPLKRKWAITRRQKPIKGGRDYAAIALEHRIYLEVEKQAARYGVSKSFFQAVVMADALGIKLDPENRF